MLTQVNEKMVPNNQTFLLKLNVKIFLQHSNVAFNFQVQQRQKRQQLKRFHGSRYQVGKVQLLWELIHTFPKLMMRCENLLRGSYVKLIHSSQLTRLRDSELTIF